MSDRVCIASKGSQNVLLSPQDMVSWYQRRTLTCCFLLTLCVTLLQRHSGFWLFRCIKLPMLCSIPWHSRFPFQADTFSTLGSTCRITAWLLTRASRMRLAPATPLTARPHAQTTAPSPGQPRCCPRSRTAAVLHNCRTKFSRMVRFRLEER